MLSIIILIGKDGGGIVKLHFGVNQQTIGVQIQKIAGILGLIVIRIIVVLMVLNSVQNLMTIRK
jgi:hypothetical protein